ncbi:tyrosine-type recombinase/integrase [Rhodopseudomonas palustris]|nr:tyrosine-type recombinase/integrase [Rhodopseudomonas palustris]
MVRAEIKGVFCTYKHRGTPRERRYWYHRKTKRPLRGEPGSAEFMIDFAEAEKLIIDYHAGRLNSLIRNYTSSDEFLKMLAPSTQADRRRMLSTVEVEFGDMPIAALEDPRVRRDFFDWRERVSRSSGPREADHRLSAVSAMLTWGVQRGHLLNNHVKGFRRLYHSDRSEMIWLPEHVAAFMAVAPIELQRALIIALHTGQRQADILRMPWTAYDGNAVTVRPAKNNRSGRRAKPVRVPCTKALRTMLGKVKRASPLILTTKTGRAFQKRHFARQWEIATKAAGLDAVEIGGATVGLHFHDLRGTAVTMLSEAGCTPQEIATITGHSLKRIHEILELYLARTRTLAEGAIAKFENSPRTKFANRLQTRAASKTVKKGKSSVK